MDSRLVERLARLWGLSATYQDIWGQRRMASDEGLFRTLQLLGAEIAQPADLAAAIRVRRQERCRQILEPIEVAWDGQPKEIPVRLEVRDHHHAYRCRLELEGGGHRDLSGQLSTLPLRRQRVVEGVGYEVRSLALPWDLPWGYHRLALEFGDRRSESLLIVAPERAYRAADGPQLTWGVFLPLYALHRQGPRGAGDFSDLDVLMQWTADQGGHLVATLPLLSTLWELSNDPSPYSAGTRLFWNEFYLDLPGIPELAACPAARGLLEGGDPAGGPQPVDTGRSPGFRSPGGRSSGWIDYSGEMATKRRILEALCAHCFSSPGRRQQLEQFCRENPELETYAKFRAVGERLGTLWPHWPEPIRSGTIRRTDYDESVYHYHLYTQWQVEEQLRRLTDRARQRDLLWYLDFPLGVSGAGYDVWRERDSFVLEACGGAPPDSFFTKGQNWGFPPPHPHKARQTHYRYWITALRRHLQFAQVLRLDHAISLYRLYWVPHGMEAGQGVYVRYPTEELFAILSLESHRYRAQIVGENLGTVPAPVNEGMARHGIGDMYVLQYEMNPERAEPVRPVPATAVASLNTHDMPTFASFWQGLDIEDRIDLGLLAAEAAPEEHEARAARRQVLIDVLRRRGLLAADNEDLEAVLEAALALLASSPAATVLVSLEDLWQETQPQNTPGTFEERPNWRRQTRYSFEEWSRLPAVQRILQRVDQCRRAAERNLRTEPS